MTDGDIFMHGVASPAGNQASHRLYSWAAVASALLIFAGFARTFYLRGVTDAPSLSALQALHGTVMTLWFALFIVQTQLVAAGRTDLHRRLGVAGGLVAAVILPVGVMTAIDAARRGVSPTPEITPAMFMAIPMADMVVFSILVGLALWNRRRSEPHRRLMLLATLSILTPSVARLPLAFIQQGGLPVFFGITLLAVVACVAIDAVRNKRLHPAFGWGGAFVVLSVPLRLVVSGTPGWQRFATWLLS